MTIYTFLFQYSSFILTKMRRSVLLTLGITILANHLVSSQIDLGNFRQQALIEHNVKRNLHCTGPMTLTDTLNTAAQNYAEYLAANDLFQHSQAPGVGENLYQIWSSNPITYLNGKRKIHS